MKKVLLMVAMLFIAAPDMHAKGDEEEVKVVLVKEENSDNYYYEGVVPVEGVTKEEMFKRAKDWVLSNLKTEDNNIQFDQENLSIVNSSTILIKSVKRYYSAVVNLKLNLKFKDGKYKFRIDNLIVKVNSSYNTPPAPYGPDFFFMKKETKNLIREINKSVFAIASNLENVIKSGNAKKDDW